MSYNFKAPTYNEAGSLEKRQLESVDDILDFMFAGNATITLKSKKSGVRYTFRIKKANDTMPDGSPAIVSHFVALMNGPDNENDFQYLGQYYKRTGDYRHGAKSRISDSAPSAVVFGWFHRHTIQARKLHPDLEVWHEGRCGRCNRKLTVPESIARGIGPECAKYHTTRTDRAAALRGQPTQGDLSYGQ